MACFSNRALRLACGAAAWALVFSGAAQAQIFGFEFGPVGPRVYAPEYPVERFETPRRAIRAALEAQGYELLSPLERNGPVFRAHVEDVRGREFRVIVDARNGDVLERFPIRGAFGDRRFGDRDFSNGPPRPPADIGRQRFGEGYAREAPRRFPRADELAKDFDDDFERPQNRASQLPLPADKRLAPGARPTITSAPKPQNKPAKPAAVAKKPVAPKPDAARPAQKQEASAPAPAPSPVAAAKPAAKPDSRNAFLRRPNVEQRAPAKGEQPANTVKPAKTEQPNEPAAERRAPRVVYPSTTGQ